MTDDCPFSLGAQGECVLTTGGYSGPSGSTTQEWCVLYVTTCLVDHRDPILQCKANVVIHGKRVMELDNNGYQLRPNSSLGCLWAASLPRCWIVMKP